MSKFQVGDIVCFTYWYPYVERDPCSEGEIIVTTRSRTLPGILHSIEERQAHVMTTDGELINCNASTLRIPTVQEILTGFNSMI